MASVRVREQLPNKQSAKVKPVARSNNNTTTRSALAGVTNTSIATRGAKKEDDRALRQGKQIRGVVAMTRGRCSAASSFLPSGDENRERVTVRGEKEGARDEELKEKPVGRAASKISKTRAAAKKVPKSTAAVQQRPLGANTVECSEATIHRRPTLLAHVNIVTGPLPVKTRKSKQALPVTKEDKSGPLRAVVAAEYKTNDGCYVSIRVKKANSTADLDHHRAGKGAVAKTNKACAKRAVANCPQPLAKTSATDGAQKKNSIQQQSDTTTLAVQVDREERQTAPLQLVPYEPEADIDLTDDPSMCGEYAGDIYLHHRDLEQQTHYLLCASFLDHQTDITRQHRCVLVDWLAQVHYKYRLLQETMILTVDILDRYLQIAVVSKAKLQLVGLASLFISSKFEEIYAPSVYELEHIAANTYTRLEILGMEKRILHELDYRLIKPYPLHFLRRFSRLSHTDTNVHHLAKYFIDLSLLECEGSVILPSKKAAAAFILATANLYGCPTHSVWSTKLQAHTGYSLCQLSSTVKTLAVLVKTKHFTDKAAAMRERYIVNAPTDRVKSMLKDRELGLDRASI